LKHNPREVPKLRTKITPKGNRFAHQFI